MFKYKDRVKIVKGFYAGVEGILWANPAVDSYIVLLDEGTITLTSAISGDYIKLVEESNNAV